jgi:ABC-type glycerol-3-phosphate transport system substrate-binding protein
MTKTLATLAGALCLSTALAGNALAQTDLSLWYHGAGNPEEREILLGIIEDFNGSQGDWRVSLEEFPQNAYNDSIVAAALSGNLPDIIDVDGPVMPNWAWAGYMAPLQLSEGALDGFLPGAIGEWDGQVYSVGLWDAAVAMYARRSVLEENGIRIPTLEEPWTGEEFDAALETLQATGDYDYALDWHGRSGRMVPIRLFAIPAELWRRHHGSRHLSDGRRRAQWRRSHRVRRMVAVTIHAQPRARHLPGHGQPRNRLHRRQLRAAVERQLGRDPRARSLR